jgi:quercetin dioxygenase-like cupin family protein
MTPTMTEQVLIKTQDALVRVLELAAAEDGAWHHHSEIEEHLVCLTGALAVELSGPSQVVTLQPTERMHIAVARRHRVKNVAEGCSSFVLVQGPGKYDFLVD